MASYGQIALLCGKPKNARQVGYGLKRGFAGEVPAYRVVNGKGFLSGAASFELPGLQKLFLEEEGVTVEGLPGQQRVNLEQYGWKNTLREAEELAQEFEKLGI